MKLQVPEYLLCEDPASENENLFIYHTPSHSLIHVVHTDGLSTQEAAKIRSLNQRYFDYKYTNNAGNIEKILFIAQVVDPASKNIQGILAQCAHWYACYLGWEDDCEDAKAS